jgi:hypothetical protein
MFPLLELAALEIGTTRRYSNPLSLAILLFITWSINILLKSNDVETAPYMYNGKFKTLKEVLVYYNNPTTFVAGSISKKNFLNAFCNLYN